MGGKHRKEEDEDQESIDKAAQDSKDLLAWELEQEED